MGRGAGGIGTQSTMATTPTSLGGGGASTATTDVAGASGAALPASTVAGITGGGAIQGGAGLAPVIEQLNAAVAALQQALQGGGLIGGGPSAGPGCGMPACDVGIVPPPPAPVPAPGREGGGQGGEAPEQQAEQETERKPEQKPDNTAKQPEDKPARRPRREQEGADGSGGTQGSGGTKGPDGAPPPADPRVERRAELERLIREARAELERITARMDALAAEKRRLEGVSGQGGSIRAIEQRAERVRQITAEINGLRSAGGMVSGSIPTWSRELRELGS